ncbi:hypothetical protein BJ912DRAFT_320652 [Pholiota molesta]|nr:hypothetical protein BJ912DRAFT_320652 [Pholiota molesta]
MSSPIAIRRSSVSSSGSASSASTSPASPAKALYVPVHKRSASPVSSATGPSSPSHRRPESPTVNPSPTVHPHVYSTDFLLSLRPFADAEIKEKVLAACPEAVINRRVRQRVAHTVRTTPKPMATPTTAPTKTTTMQRVTPRRTRFSGRAPERRRQALNLHHDSWRSLQNTSTPLPLISL